MDIIKQTDFPIDVVIVEDNVATREGLTYLIDNSEGFSCKKSFASCESAIEYLEAHLPDIVLMDIGLDGMTGIEGVRRIKEIYPNLVVLMLTVHEDNEKVFESIKSGANGYILKKVQPSKILEAMKDAYCGGSPITPSIARKVLDVFSGKSNREKKFDLTPAEVTILKHLVDGSSYLTIANDLGKSIHTVRSHIRNIYSKLYVHTKTEAVVKALKHKIV